MIKKEYIDGRYKADFTYEKVNRASKACGPLYKWVRSQIDYSEIAERVQPLRDEVSKLAAEHASLQQKFEENASILVQFREKIARYKEEYAELIKAAESLKQDMELIIQKCGRARLCWRICRRSARWEFRGEPEPAMTLVGDVVLGGAFLAYLDISTTTEDCAAARLARSSGTRACHIPAR